MNLKTLSIVVIAAIFFTACGKEEMGDQDYNNGNNENGKNVFLKFNTKSAGLSKSVEETGSNSAAELKTAMIYFLNGEGNDAQVYTVKQVGGTNSDVSLSELQKGYQFTKIPKDVKSVYVVGNFEAAGFPKAVGMSLADIKRTVVDIQKNNTVLGGPVLSTVLDGQSPVVPYSGNETGWSNTINTPGVDDYYASVEVSPVTARIEIMKLEYNDEGLSEFNVEGIYVNHYYSDLTLLSLQTDAKEGTLVENSSDVTKYTGSAYGDYTSMFDLVGTVAQVTNGKAVVTAGGEKDLWVYQVFGNCKPAHLVIKLTNLVNADQNNTQVIGDRYLTVKGFRSNEGEELQTLERGKIYKLSNILFTDKDISVIPEPGDISVWVEVSVADWVTVGVNPIL